jgi:hypothetical protein
MVCLYADVENLCLNTLGFVYTQTNDRLWRKNRQPPPETAANQTCYGRDINRNWEHNWDANTRGASDDECSQVYRGVRRNIRDEQGIKLYIDWHSYSQLILCPFGHDETLYAPSLGKWTNAASLMSQEIARNSSNATTYTFGPSGAVLYPTTGVGVDHVYAVGRAEWSYTIVLQLKSRGLVRRFCWDSWITSSLKIRAHQSSISKCIDSSDLQSDLVNQTVISLVPPIMPIQSIFEPCSCSRNYR